MLDDLTLEDLKDMDVILIGAGVGAANVLWRARHHRSLCIDSGYVLDCLENPALRGTRVFTRAETPVS
jgi:hypothetical protein